MHQMRFTAFICIVLVNNREVILEMKQLSRSKMNTTPLKTSTWQCHLHAFE